MLAGRCLAYGEGTAYRALADIVRGLGGDPRARVEELLAGDEQAMRGILGAIGLSDEPAQAEETAWALRRLLERLARERPLVVAVEDIHWAQPALLDLLDHVVALSSGAPILLVCLTRPELLETRPAWAAPQPNRCVSCSTRSATRRRASSPSASERASCADRIARRAEGNPLFVEQLVAVDAGQATASCPRASRPCSRRASTGSSRPSARCCSAPRSRAARFTPARSRPLLPEPERRGVGTRPRRRSRARA